MNKRSLSLSLAALAAVVAGGASAARHQHLTDFEAPTAGNSALNIKGLDAESEHGGGTGGAPAAVATENSVGANVIQNTAQALVGGTGETGYHARNLAQAATRQVQQQSAIPASSSVQQMGAGEEQAVDPAAKATGPANASTTLKADADPADALNGQARTV